MKRAFRLPPVNRMLPYIVGLLCAGLFATTALILISPSFDPESPQSADAGAISPHGFKGIYKLLEANGYISEINRRETGPQKTYDLEIITLEAVDSVFAVYAPANKSAGPSQSADENASEDQSSADDPDQEAILARRKTEETHPSVSNSEDLKQAGYGADKAKSDHILYEAQGRTVLVVLPKWQADAHRTRPRWSQNEWPESYPTLLNLMRLLSDTKAETGEVDWAELEVTMTEPVIPVEYQFARAPSNISRSVTLQPAQGQNLFAGPINIKGIKGLQSIRVVEGGHKLTPILLGPAGEIILAQVNALPGERPLHQPVYLLSDPDILNNQILSDPQKVSAAFTVISALHSKTAARPSVVFNLTFNGHSVDRSLLHHIASPPFIAVPLCFMVLGLGLMWAAFARFGPAQEGIATAPLGRGVIILADNAARLLAKAGREPKLALPYAHMVRDAALKSRNLVGDTSASTDELADQLSAHSGTSETYSAIARDAAKVKTTTDLIRLCQRLHKWRVETGASHSHLTTSRTEN